MPPFFPTKEARSAMAHGGNEMNFRVAVALALLVVCMNVACGDDGPAAVEGAAGSAGSGGLFGGMPQPQAEGGDGPGGEAGALSGGRCAAVPASADARIDNFEDGDDLPIVEPGRLGAWHLPVLEGNEMLTFTVEAGGANGSDFAAHVTISGVSEITGVAASLRFDASGVACPYDASGYSGLAFYAKGADNLIVQLQTTDVFSTEFGGTCDASVEQCWDKHRKLVPLTAEWEYHEATWDLFSQAGWGVVAPFAADHLLGVEFVVAPSAEPVEIWIDEIRFLP
jgi:hypothetical protein